MHKTLHGCRRYASHLATPIFDFHDGRKSRFWSLITCFRHSWGSYIIHILYIYTRIPRHGECKFGVQLVNSPMSLVEGWKFIPAAGAGGDMGIQKSNCGSGGPLVYEQCSRGPLVGCFVGCYYPLKMGIVRIQFLWRFVMNQSGFPWNVTKGTVNAAQL